MAVEEVSVSTDFAISLLPAYLVQCPKRHRCASRERPRQPGQRQRPRERHTKPQHRSPTKRRPGSNHCRVGHGAAPSRMEAA